MGPYVYLMFLVIIPFSLGIKPSKKVEVIILRILECFIVVYYGLAKISFDCMSTIFAYTLSTALSIVFLTFIRESDLQGNPDTQRTNTSYQVFKAGWVVLTYAGFVAMCLDQTQKRKQQFLINYKLEQQKRSYENILDSFQQGILVASSAIDGNILEQNSNQRDFSLGQGQEQLLKLTYINEELTRFFEVDCVGSESHQNNNNYNEKHWRNEYLNKKLFQQYQVGDSRSIKLLECKSLSEILQIFIEQNIQRQYFLIDIRHLSSEQATLFDREPEVIEIELFKVFFEDKDSILVIIKNISQLLNSEKEKNINRYQEMLTATISHELMNPLNSIINLSNLAEQQYGGPKIYQKLVQDWIGFFQIINYSSKMMYHMVKSQIDIQQFKQNKFNSKISAQKPSDVVKQVADLFKVQLTTKQVSLDIVESADMPKILYGDWERYQQILVNFLQNSVKFTQKGEINIVLAFESYETSSSVCIDPKYIQDKCERCGYLITKVIDTGVGMSELTKQSLFKLFNNQDQNEKGMIGTSGIGLGLSMSYDLIKALRGRVQIESEPNRRTEVFIKLGVSQEFCVRGHSNTGIYSINQTNSLFRSQSKNDSKNRSQKFDQQFNGFKEPQAFLAIRNQNSMASSQQVSIADDHSNYRRPFQVGGIIKQESIISKKVYNMNPEITRSAQHRRVFGEDFDINQINKAQEILDDQHQQRQNPKLSRFFQKGSSHRMLLQPRSYKKNQIEIPSQKLPSKNKNMDQFSSIFSINLKGNGQESDSSSIYSIKKRKNNKSLRSLEENNLKFGKQMSISSISNKDRALKEYKQSQYRKGSIIQDNRGKNNFINESSYFNESQNINLVQNEKNHYYEEQSDVGDLSEMLSNTSSPYKRSHRPFLKSTIERVINPQIPNYQREDFTLSKNDRPNHRVQLENKYQLEMRNNLQRIQQLNNLNYLQSFNDLNQILHRSQNSHQRTYQDQGNSQSMQNLSQTPSSHLPTFNKELPSRNIFNTQEPLGSYMQSDDPTMIRANQINIVINSTNKLPNQHDGQGVEDMSSGSIPHIQTQNSDQKAPSTPALSQNDYQSRDQLRQMNMNFQRKMTLGKPIMEQDEESDGTYLRQQSSKKESLKDNDESQVSRRPREITSMANIAGPDTYDIDLGNHRTVLTTMKHEVSANFNTDEFTNNLLDYNGESPSKIQIKLQQKCEDHAQILIVDDSMFNLITLELILSQMFQVKCDKAFNGLEAVNLYQKNLEMDCCDKKYKLVLMDLNMPIMDGYESTKQIFELFKKKYSAKKYPNGDALTIVAITAFVNDENINNCYKVGMEEVMNKPVNQDKLLSVLKKYYYYT
eukprot:403347790